ncbi:MAG TPA: LUD domain-containing protein [Thermoleophilia bacterium]|nr:LUD domain-containing protein [Thermoleophilia bacterium]
MSGTRELVLSRVRAALAGPSPERQAEPAAERWADEGEPSAGGRETLDEADGAARDQEPGSDRLVELLTARLLDYGAAVVEVGADDVAPALDRVLAAEGAARVAVPPDLPASWRPRSVTVVDDAGLGAVELDELDGAVTGCTLAIAETGTLLLTAAPAEGRRALTLVPDLFVCILRRASVVADAGAALAAVAPLVRDERRPLTFVSGPSATSDIELHRVEGVHGPRRLVVLVVEE